VYLTKLTTKIFKNSFQMIDSNSLGIAKQTNHPEKSRSEME
jgi:hypothetical protein